MTNLKRLQDTLNTIKSISNVQEQARQLFRFVSDSGMSSLEDIYYDNIVRKATVCDDIINSASERNLEAIHNFLMGITDWSAEYFQVDGYGNYATLTSEYLLTLIEDMETELQAD